MINFNPTNNYYGLDLSKDSNRVIYDFWGFIKTLVTLASTAEIQKEILGPGDVANEIAVDFETYYPSNVVSFLDNKLLNDTHVSKLKLLDKYLEDRSGDKMPNFWLDSSLDTHPNWEQVRYLAIDVLSSLTYGKLKIEVERTAIKSNDENETPISVVNTRTRLVK